ncbi:MAG: hypothetical protein V4550_04350 [Gemmatimonadota bacterium]
MGLSIHYEFRLPATTTPAQVDTLLGALRTFALTLPFTDVTGIDGDQLTSPSLRDDRLENGWLGFWSSIVATPYGDDDEPMYGDEATARGFLINPGEGCESALVGFLLRATATDARREWFWYCSCKTQYAGVVSDEHFVACHTSLVALLDHAVSLGVDVTVHDETHYWETRDISRLLAELGAMNRLIAAFAGKLADRLGDDRSIQAPIFEHPEFEHLEMGQ